MSYETVRLATGRRTGHSWRLLTVLVLVAAGTVLFVPGTAAGHVKAKYRAEYTRQLTSLRKSFNVYAIQYDNAKDQSTSLAETLAPMIGDPA